MKFQAPTILFATLLVAGTVFAASHADVIKQRQASMGEVRGISKALNNMSRGRAEFDLAVVTSAGERLAIVATEYPMLFPVGSETGGETEAAATIWSDAEGFLEQSMALAAAGDLLAAATDEASFAAGLDAMNGTCRSCHSTYRVK